MSHIKIDILKIPFEQLSETSYITWIVTNDTKQGGISSLTILWYGVMPGGSYLSLQNEACEDKIMCNITRRKNN